ncbi:AMP-binding protein, partial [Kitasatospora sp. NPDC058170]|uniref:AMP-binding protein n=1 Tax=Kitasatospora sp. NPDC058170 TaxID=3346364 RepID=UPI0036DF5854
VAQARLRIPREEHQNFFTTLLGDITEPTAPFGLADARGDGSTTTEVTASLDPELADRVREQARRLGVSPATLFHLVWARITASAAALDDVVFGTVLFGRMQAGSGADRVPGLFINTLPVRVRTGDTTAVEAVRSMQGQLADLLVHEHAPLVLAQQASNLPAQTPLFTSVLNYRHSSEADQGPDSALEGVELLQAQERTNYPLAVSVDDMGSGFLLTVQAAAPVDPALVAALVQTATDNLTAALETAPHTPLHSIEILDDAQRRRLLTEWNDTARDLPAATLPALFQAQAARTPDATALIHQDEELSYAEVNERANRLAHLLTEHGVGPETLVGVLMGRSTDLVISLLAILKAGGAYLPIDPNYPADRITYMLGDARPTLVITHQDLQHTLPATEATALIVLDDPDTLARLAELAATDPESGLLPSHPAYVIYTSGSTGRPKGVVVPHHGLASL